MSHEFIETDLQTSVHDLGNLSIRREGEGMKLEAPRRPGLGAPAPSPRAGQLSAPAARPWAREPAPPAPGGPASQVSYPLPLFLLTSYQDHELKFANQFL